MLGFKFVSLPALILLALGAVGQDTYVEPVPLYGQCEFLACFYTAMDSLLI
jgi:hypothetical protein